jgi:hypothetical protein
MCHQIKFNNRKQAATTKCIVIHSLRNLSWTVTTHLSHLNPVSHQADSGLREVSANLELSTADLKILLFILFLQLYETADVFQPWMMDAELSVWQVW